MMRSWRVFMAAPLRRSGSSGKRQFPERTDELSLSSAWAQPELGPNSGELGLSSARSSA